MNDQENMGTVDLSITVTEETYQKLQKISDVTHIECQDLITEVVTQFAHENKKIIEQLKNGYQKMGDVNRTLTQNFLYADIEALRHLDNN